MFKMGLRYQARLHVCTRMPKFCALLWTEEEQGNGSKTEGYKTYCTDKHVDTLCEACQTTTPASTHSHTCCSSASTLTILRRPSLVSVLFSGRHLTTTLTHSALAGEPSIRFATTHARLSVKTSRLDTSLAAYVFPSQSTRCRARQNTT